MNANSKSNLEASVRTEKARVENVDEMIDGQPDADFQRLSEEKPQSMLNEFVEFLWHDKKWWLAPIVVVLLVISLFIVLTNSVIGPFIYVFF